jgi:hypothetical protein
MAVLAEKSLVEVCWAYVDDASARQNTIIKCRIDDLDKQIFIKFSILYQLHSRISYVHTGHVGVPFYTRNSNTSLPEKTAISDWRFLTTSEGCMDPVFRSQLEDVASTTQRALVTVQVLPWLPTCSEKAHCLFLADRS